MTTSLGSFVRHVTTYPVDDPENFNAFHFDSYRMGEHIAKKVTMLYEQHRNEPLRGPLRFVDDTTGVVIELDLAALFHHVHNAQENA